jgi:MFS family permease
LVQILGAPTAVLLDAVSFAGSAALVARIAVDEPPADAVRNPLLSEIKAGFRYMFNEPTLRAIALSGGVGVLFFSIREPLLRVFALDTKQLSPGEYGLIFSIAAVGYAIGSFLPGPLARRFGIGHAIVWPHLGLGAWGLLIALAVTLDWHAIRVIALMLFLEGLMEPANNINQLSLRLALMPPAMRGRLTSVARFMIRGAYPLGTLAGGAMGEVIGIKGALWISALAGPLGAACYLGSPVLRYRRLPEFQTD